MAWGVDVSLATPYLVNIGSGDGPDPEQGNETMRYVKTPETKWIEPKLGCSDEEMDATLRRNRENFDRAWDRASAKDRLINDMINEIYEGRADMAEAESARRLMWMERPECQNAHVSAWIDEQWKVSHRRFYDATNSLGELAGGTYVKGGK